MAHWTGIDVPSLITRTAIVTGTGGLGFETALILAEASARVIIAGRNELKGKAAIEQIRRRVPGANVRFELLDLACLASIAAFAARLRNSQSSLDLLINNAAVMATPRRRVTSDSFELQFGTNYLGHFALTAQLLPLLCVGSMPRVVSLSSIAARDAVMRFDDLQSERFYQPMATYGQSKLACLLFALELQRRSEMAGWGIQSVAAHPGVSRTNLIPNGFGANSAAGVLRRLMWFLFQPAAQGALPILFAATSPLAQGGGYYGPNRLGETRGFPAPAKVPAQATDVDSAARLWRESEQLTGISFP